METRSALKQTRGNRSRAAELLGISGPTSIASQGAGRKNSLPSKKSPRFQLQQFPALARVVGQDKRSAEIQSLQKVFDKILGILQADGAADDVISKRVAKAAS